MQRLAWYAINGEDLENEALIAAERKILTNLGAPDVEKIDIITAEPEDRDDVIIDANVPDSFAEWMRTNRPGVILEDQ